MRKSVYHDFYHLPFYHVLAREVGEGEPFLFVYENEEYMIALPLLIRPIHTVAIKVSDEQSWFDATSVYGYVGPIASHADIPPAVLLDFQDSLMNTLSERRVVSLFSRLHPFCDQSIFVSGLGDLVTHGRTISIDLSVGEKDQLAQYRRNHLREIRKLKEAGVTCVEDVGFQHLDDFVNLYHETMKRVQAAPEYFYPRSYFQHLVETDEAEVLLLFCSLAEDVMSAGIFVRCEGTVEYHLGGTSRSEIKHSPMKLLLDTARHWAYEKGVKAFHLGGGVGSHEDSLFSFKKGFSGRMHFFRTWRWVVLPSVYEQLTALHGRWLADRGYPKPAEDFFPQYRSTVPVVLSA